MNDESLKKILSVLNEVRQSIHDDASVSTIEQLDEAIRLLERCEKEQNAEALHTAFALIGKVLLALPSIQKLVDTFLE